ncbi:hypothetical protein LB505_005619 [Fusarium chuoi]|nr:hypothetical protein LB505_005619 [Fusarium chuoi]
MGVDITKHQRLIRLHDLASKSVSGRYHEEESNKGHSNWKPEEHPDWLLLEIESNMMIRPVQVDVALATISPGSGSNSGKPPVLSLWLRQHSPTRNSLCESLYQKLFSNKQLSCCRPDSGVSLEGVFGMSPSHVGLRLPRKIYEPTIQSTEICSSLVVS